MAECRAREERMAKEQALAKQKEALKGKMAGTVNKSNKTKTAPAPKKQLTVETEHQKVEKSSKTEKLLDAPEQPQLMNEEPPLGDDDFDRDEDEAPMSKDRLEKESTNSVSSLQRLQGDDLGNEEKESMQKTLSSAQLKQMLGQAEEGDEKEEEKGANPSREEDKEAPRDHNDILLEEANPGERKDQEQLNQELIDKYFKEDDPKEPGDNSREFVDDDDERDDEDSDEEGDQQAILAKSGPPAAEQPPSDPPSDPYSNSAMNMTMAKTIKGNANIFGLDTSNPPSDNPEPNRYTQFDDLDEEEDERQPAGTAEQKEQLPEEAAVTQSSSQPSQGDEQILESQKQGSLASGSEALFTDKQSHSLTPEPKKKRKEEEKLEASDKHQTGSSSEHQELGENDQEEECISDSGSTSSNTQNQ